MKLRIRGNTIRLRVTRSEVDTFAEAGAISETLEFPDGNTLTYRLISDGHATQPAAQMADGVISIRLPREQVQQWLAPDQVGVAASHTMPGGQSFDLLVEKDFACLVTREGEDDSDAFANPAAADTTAANPDE